MAHLAGLEAIAFDDRIWRYMLTLGKDAGRSAAVDGCSAAGWRRRGPSMPWVTVLKAENRVIGSTRFMDFDLRA